MSARSALILSLLTKTGALVLLAGVLFLFYLAEAFTDGGGLAFALFIFPLSLGYATQVIFDPKVEHRKWAVFGVCALATVILTAILLATQVESMACAVMAFPIFFLIEFFGILLARWLLRTTPTDVPNGLKSSLLIVAFLPGFFSLSLPVWTGHYTVTNVIEIAATPEQTWRQIVSFPQVKPDERLWTVSHNLIGTPVPQYSEIVDRARTAVWSENVVYDEVLTHVAAPTEMAWRIRFAEGFQMHDSFQRILPDSEQFELLRGRYDLSFDGSTTLVTLSTDYRLKTTFNAYVALWGGLFLADNHNSILHVLKLRAERA